MIRKVVAATARLHKQPPGSCQSCRPQLQGLDSPVSDKEKPQLQDSTPEIISKLSRAHNLSIGSHFFCYICLVLISNIILNY
jgi:hypothetical protein